MAASPSARTVYLKLHPTVRTFSERREVLRVLERFGEVTMFKSYKYNPRLPTPNTFLALFASESSAKDLINASPIRYTLIANPTPPPSDASPEPAAARTSSAIPPRPASSPSPSPSSPLDRKQKQSQTPHRDPKSQADPDAGARAEHDPQPFQLHAYPSSHDHAAFLSSPIHSPFRGPWKPALPSWSYVSSSLSQIIPSSIYSAGLMDWEVLRDPEEGGEKGETAGAGFWLKGREMRRVEKGRPRVMGGLRGLREKAGEMQGEKVD